MNASTEVETIHVGHDVIRFLVEADRTAGSASVFEFDVPSGGMVPPPHSHDAWEETIYGLRGTLTWTIDGTPRDVSAGEVVVIPRGVVHSFENHGEQTATQLAIVTPGILGPQYFRDIAAVLAAGDPPDVARLLGVMTDHGLRPAVPTS